MMLFNAIYNTFLQQKQEFPRLSGLSKRDRIFKCLIRDLNLVIYQRVSFTSPMFAIAFDLDTKILEKEYGASYNNAYSEIGKFLAARNFQQKQGSLYYGDMDKVNAVSTVLTIADLSAKYSWFQKSVRDIRMLRIDSFDDLMPAVKSRH